MSGYVKALLADYVHERVSVDTAIAVSQALQCVIRGCGEDAVAEAMRIAMGHTTEERFNPYVVAVFEQLAVLLRANDSQFITRNLRLYKRYGILASLLADQVSAFGGHNTKKGTDESVSLE